MDSCISFSGSWRFIQLRIYIARKVVKFPRPVQLSVILLTFPDIRNTVSCMRLRIWWRLTVRWPVSVQNWLAIRRIRRRIKNDPWRKAKVPEDDYDRKAKSEEE